MNFNLDADINNLLFCLYMEEQEHKNNDKESNVNEKGFWWEDSPPISENED